MAGPVALIDTSVLYPAGRRRRMDVDNEEVKLANSIVAGIVDGKLPPVRVLTSIEQETVDHIKDDAGTSTLVERMQFWRSTPRIDFRHPSEPVITAARDLVTSYDELEFADAASIAYLNSLDTDRTAIFTLERKTRQLFWNLGIEPVDQPRNPFAP